MLRKLSQIKKNRRQILGRNERFLEYIRPNNLRSAVQIADDKILTKKILATAQIPVPEMIAEIKNQQDIENLDIETLPKSFVVKPVRGLMGSGIEIFYNRDKEGNLIKADGSRMSIRDLKVYMKDILDGKFSLFNEPDTILIEERVKIHKAFKYYTYKGAPDVRILVFNKIPIMSYLRLPTKASQGKANLDKGAVGAGIDMAVGKTTYAIVGKSTPVEYTPDYKLKVSGIKVPYWDKILRYAIQASEASGLGFAAVDFLIDRDKGPVIVELNARPGLSIQLSNHAGLRARLKKASGIKVTTVEKGVRLAKDLFGGEIEEGIEAISGKDVIGIYENVTLFGVNGKEHETKAKIDTGADSTSIDTEVARNLGYGEIIDEIAKRNIPHNVEKEEGRAIMKSLDEELIPKYEFLTDIRMIASSHGRSLRPSIKIDLKLGDTTFSTTATIFDRSHLVYPVIIGRKSLTKFLVDPSKTR